MFFWHVSKNLYFSLHCARGTTIARLLCNFLILGPVIERREARPWLEVCDWHVFVVIEGGSCTYSTQFECFWRTKLRTSPITIWNEKWFVNICVRNFNDVERIEAIIGHLACHVLITSQFSYLLTLWFRLVTGITMPVVVIELLSQQFIKFGQSNSIATMYYWDWDCFRWWYFQNSISTIRHIIIFITQTFNWLLIQLVKLLENRSSPRMYLSWGPTTIWITKTKLISESLYHKVMLLIKTLQLTLHKDITS